MKNNSLTKVCTFGQPECTDSFGLMSFHDSNETRMFTINYIQLLYTAILFEGCEGEGEEEEEEDISIIFSRIRFPA